MTLRLYDSKTQRHNHKENTGVRRQNSGEKRRVPTKTSDHGRLTIIYLKGGVWARKLLF